MRDGTGDKMLRAIIDGRDLSTSAILDAGYSVFVLDSVHPLALETVVRACRMSEHRDLCVMMPC